MDEDSDSSACVALSAPNTVASAGTLVADSMDFSHPSSMNVPRSMGLESTRLLFVANNGQQRRNSRDDKEVFYDCEETQESRGAGPSRCQLDDPGAIREALERAANATQMLLKNFDKSGGWNQPCAVTLELTARLVDPKKSRAGCPLHGKPVTVQMPLEFNPQGTKITTCQKRKMPCKTRKKPVCQCRSQGPMDPDPMSQAPNSGKSVSEQFHPCDSVLSERSRSDAFVGSCGDSSSRSCYCPQRTFRQTYDPEAREVISISLLTVPELQCESEEEVSLHEKVEELVQEEEEEEEDEEDEPQLGRLGPDTESEESEPESSDGYETERERLLTPEPTPQAPTTSKRYYMVLPQNKEFSNCSPCRYDPSPIMDEEGNVFCPGNCGCCLCPWMKRSLATNWEHINVKVCRCVQRGTIFTKFEDREVCSQTSYFDFCPCREKAEAKYLELYHREMWSRPDAIRGREIQLSEIKELIAPTAHPTE